MKILKEGDATKRPRPIEFTCDNCGCVFAQIARKQLQANYKIGRGIIPLPLHLFIFII